MSTKNLEERALLAAKKFLEYRDYKILDVGWREGAEIVAEYDGELVFCEVKVCEEEFDNSQDKKLAARERLMLEYAKEHDLMPVQIRYDAINLIVLDENRAIIRHHVNCINGF